MPTPAKPQRPKRAVTRSLRFTADEWATVGAKLAGRDFSAVARALLLETAIPEPRVKVVREVVRRRMTEAEAAKTRQMAWIGNNLNQLAKLANTRRDAFAVLGELVSIEREVRRLADAG